MTALIRNRKRFKRTILLGAIVIYALTLLFTRLYSVSIDNFLISCVLHGVYNTDNYCSFLHPLLSGIVRLLNQLAPSADFFCLLQIIFTFSGVALLLFYLFKLVQDPRKQLFFSAFLVLCAVSLNLAHSNFTIAAAFFSFVGLFSIRLSISRLSGGLWIAIGLVYSAFGILWRAESFLLLIPFFLLSVFVNGLLSKGNRRRTALSLLALCILSGSLFLSKHIKDSSPLYEEAMAYSDARSALQDFPVLSYEEARSQFSENGISENDYLAATDTLLLDFPGETTAFLKKIAELAGSSFSLRFSEVISDFLYDTETDALLNLAILSLAVLLSFIFLFQCKMSRCCRIELILSLLGGLAILVFFLFLGRVQDRIICAVLFGLFLVGLPHLLSLQEEQTAGKRKRVIALFLILLLSGNAVSVFVQNRSLPQNVFKAASSPEYGPYEVLLDNKNTYIWDTYYMKNFIFETLVPAGKLYEEDFIDNNLADGEWTYGQPYFNSYLMRCGLTDPVDELLHSGSCYYIGRQYRKDILLNYIHEHYDADATVEKCGDIILDDERSLSVFRFQPGS